jgi:predicted transcriptional regulator
VRTVLRRLEEKGYVAHSVDCRTFVYHATEPRSRVAARAVKHIVDWFCENVLWPSFSTGLRPVANKGMPLP